MKVAHVVDSMEMGGAEILVSQMCHLQRRQGHDPSVYAVAALGVLGERLRQEGFHVEAQVGHHLADAALAFLKIFRRVRPDVVHLHNPTPTIYAGPSARLAGVPSIVSTRHSLVAAPRHRTMERKFAMSARFCDWVTGICDATRENLLEAGSAPARKLVRVYNGVLPIPQSAETIAVSESQFTLLYVGRLEPVKNHALLLHAVQSALSAVPGLQLWIVGEGSERSRLEHLAATLGIADHVRFWGQQLDVTPYFNAAHAFAMSSRSEGLPTSLLQAFSIGIPAIVTAVGGMAEVVRLADAGYLVNPADCAGMTAAIVRMARNPGERARFGRNAGAAFLKHFTLETMVDSYADLYRNTPRALARAGD